MESFPPRTGSDCCYFYLFLAALGLYAVHELLIAVSHLLFLWLPGPRHPGSEAVMLGRSCSVVGGTFPDQGLNLGPLHWQVDPGPLDLREVLTPVLFVKVTFDY